MFEQYLASTPIIDWKHSLILGLSRKLFNQADSPLGLARLSFEWVRDNIRHSSDYRLNPVTCTASDVLSARTGFCFAKSHLLAAVLRANGIPAGICYQRLRYDDEGFRYTLHGLNAVYLPETGWYRIDPRGDGQGISTCFNPPMEFLAFPADKQGEAMLPEIWPEPLPVVVEVLRASDTYEQVLENLPDLELIIG
ncbi:MAG: transglutaminase family protein [Pseudomonadota bacterium]|nr:transglutaminase family protein [Pseudomonadota bacterium]